MRVRIEPRLTKQKNYGPNHRDVPAYALWEELYDSILQRLKKQELRLKKK